MPTGKNRRIVPLDTGEIDITRRVEGGSSSSGSILESCAKTHFLIGGGVFVSAILVLGIILVSIGGDSTTSSSPFPSSIQPSPSPSPPLMTTEIVETTSTEFMNASTTQASVTTEIVETTSTEFVSTSTTQASVTTQAPLVSTTEIVETTSTEFVNASTTRASVTTEIVETTSTEFMNASTTQASVTTQDVVTTNSNIESTSESSPALSDTSIAVLMTFVIIAILAIVGFAMYSLFVKRSAKVKMNSTSTSLTSVDLSTVKTHEKAKETQKPLISKSSNPLKETKPDSTLRRTHDKQVMTHSRTGHAVLRFVPDVHHTQTLPVHWLHDDMDHKIRKEGRHNHLSRDVGFVSLPLGLPTKSGFRKVKN